MTAAVLVNLDLAAAEAAGRICEAIGEQCTKNRKVEAKDLENLATKAAGVVQESGPFACGLFLVSRSGSGDDLKKMGPEEVAAHFVLSEILSLPGNVAFSGIQPIWNGGKLAAAEVGPAKREIVSHLLKIGGVEITRLILIKQVWEQVLTYTRYMARAQRRA